MVRGYIDRRLNRTAIRRIHITIKTWANFSFTDRKIIA
jgi:hypothetical protein